jgi:hypothetical protein
VYGLVAPVFPSDITAEFDLAHVLAGGRVVFTSDQHFGVGSNLILPGRGKHSFLDIQKATNCVSNKLQGRIWAMDGKHAAVAKWATKTGLSLGCRLPLPLAPRHQPNLLTAVHLAN